MTRQRRIIVIVALLGLAGIWPAATLASPLLSGYGGPGQGNQAILGSALLNGGGRGGGSGAAPTAATSGGAQLAAPSGASGPTRAAAPTGSRVRHRSASPGRTSRQASAATASAAEAYAALERGAARPSAFLGLSGDDLLYILLGLGVLAFTGIVTSRVARGGGAGEHAG
jgi:hypothetical protein